MAAKNVNCNADYTFQHDLEVPVTTTGTMGPPTLGAVTGVKLRLSATKNGVALNAAVNNLAASERSAKAGRFYVAVDAALLATHVLAMVGEGGAFYAIWFKSGDFENEGVRFTARDGTYQ